MDAALKKGDLKFTLNGYKLKGSWVLVRTSGRYAGARSGQRGPELAAHQAPRRLVGRPRHHRVRAAAASRATATSKTSSPRTRRRSGGRTARPRAATPARCSQDHRARRRASKAASRAPPGQAGHAPRPRARPGSSPSSSQSPAEQPPREHAPDRVGQPQAIVARDLAGPELAADQLAVLRQLARRERLLVLERVAAEHLRVTATSCW